MKRIRLVFMLFVIVLSGCGTSTSSSSTPTTVIATQAPVLAQGTEGYPWWNDTVFYEIFVRSFQDSNGDGIGDFNGISEKMEYLQKLGIRGIWLMPIFPSPSYHGYDITDYYAVNPDYGTIDDFKHLLEEAHKRGIRIIIDLVINHTSAQHPWFQKSLENDPQYADWYVWSDTDPGGVGPWGETVWYKASNGKYYYAVFWDQMPDLNFKNLSVQQEIQKITSFWLKDVGVDGFRLDGARYYVEEDKTLADSPANHEFLKEWAASYRTINPQAFSVGEIWTENFTVSSYTKDKTQVDSAFNFDLASAIIKSLNAGNNSTLSFTFKATVKLFPDQNNSNFITNHDMDRAMGQLGGDEDKAGAAAGILFTAPGIPFIYYGEEIGMQGKKPDENIRTPMQWTDEKGAGFTTGTPWEQINSSYILINAAKQTGQTNSLLEYYRKLIQLRNAHSALRIGKTFAADSDSNKLWAYLRVSKDEVILTVINLDDQPVTDNQLDLTTGPLSGKYTATSLLDNSRVNAVQANDYGGFTAYKPLVEIPKYGVIVIQLTPQK
jgi:Glycosidases